MRVTLTSVALLTAIFLMFGVSPASATECTHAERTSGQCSGVGAVVTGEGVTVSGTQVTPGSSGSSPRGSWSPPPPRDPVLGSAQCEGQDCGTLSRHVTVERAGGARDPNTAELSQ